MKLLLQQDRLPTKLLRPSLIRPLYRSLRAAGRTFDVREDAETSILLTDDTRIRALNNEFRGLDKPTDVLSFPQQDPVTLGDIAISVDTAQRQADAASWSVSSELALLGVHGFLHLIGYDDEDLDGAREMETLTRDILISAKIQLPSGDHPFFRSFIDDE